MLDLLTNLYQGSCVANYETQTRLHARRRRAADFCLYLVNTLISHSNALTKSVTIVKLLSFCLSSLSIAFDDSTLQNSRLSSYYREYR